MARKYYGSFKSINNITYKVEIHDAPTGSTTAGTDLKLATDGFSLERDGEGNKWWDSQVLASRITAEFVMPNSTVLSDFLALQTEAETYWTMVVWRGSDLFFVGRIIADQMTRLRESLDSKPIIKLTAVDGLELLDGYNVKASWFSSDNIQVNVLVRNCLHELDLHDYWPYLGKSDYYLFDAMSMYAADATRKGFDMLRVNINTFLEDYDPFQDVKAIDLAANWYYDLNMITCKEALEQVMQIFGCRFIHAEGGYWFYDASSYKDVTLPYRRYNYTANYQGTGTLTHRQQLGTLPSRPQWAAKPSLYYQPAVKLLTVDTERINAATVFRTRPNKSTSALEAEFTEIPTGSTPDAAPLKIKVVVKSNFPAVQNDARVDYEYKLKIWLEDGLGGIKILNGDGYWITATSVPNGVEKVRVTQMQGSWVTYKFEMQCTTPPAGFNILKVKIDSVQTLISLLYQNNMPKLLRPAKQTSTWSTPAAFNVSYWGSIQVAFAETSDYQNPDFVWNISEDFTPNTSNSVNSTQVQINPKYYYSGNKYGIGNIWANDGTKYVIADEFYGGWDSVTKGTVTKMLGVGLSSLYADFMPVVRGTWIDSGSYHLMKSLYFDNYVWVLNGVSFNPRFDTWEGEWLGVAPVYTNTTTTGEGLRISNEQGDILRDRVNLIETQVNNYQSAISHQPATFLEYLVNEADGAPTAQPTQNIIWETQLRYDDSTEAVEWYLQEHGAPISYTVGTHTLTNGYELIVCNSVDGNITVELPDADQSRGKKYIFIKTNSNHTVTIDAGTFLINDSATTTISSKYESKTVMSDGSKWFIVGKV
jgi:hypothetical protein